MKKLSILCLAVAMSITALTAEFGVNVSVSTDGFEDAAAITTSVTYENEYLYGTLGVANSTVELERASKEDSNITGFTVSAAYKLPLSAENTALFGIRYTGLSGESAENDIETASKIALTAGLKTALNSSVSVLAELDVYSSTTTDIDMSTKYERTGANFLNGGRIGLAYAF